MSINIDSGQESEHESLGYGGAAETLPLLSEDVDDNGDYFVRNQEEQIET